jgi:hypothetical protein
MKKALWVSLALASAMAAHAQSWVVRGNFNNWGVNGDVVLTQQGDGSWTGSASGLTAGSITEFKVTKPDWSVNSPASNARMVIGSSGTINFKFWENAPNDGWLPLSGSRVGYTNDNAHAWDLMGAFNGWSGPMSMSSLGNGVYQGTTTMSAGTYEGKFRKANDWDISIGTGFANYGNNFSITLPTTGLYNYTLDLPNGRYKFEAVPEPATMAALGLGVAAMIRRRKK